MNLKKITWKNIKSYIQGNLRYYCYYAQDRIDKDVMKNCGIKIHPDGRHEDYYNGNLFLAKIKAKWNLFVYSLLPIHIREQIDVRINSIPEECLMSGQCQMCGCATTALQMADKACDKPCYPKMIDKIEWESLYDSKTKSTNGDSFAFAGKLWVVANNKFVDYQRHLSNLLRDKKENQKL